MASIDRCDNEELIASKINTCIKKCRELSPNNSHLFNHFLNKIKNNLLVNLAYYSYGNGYILDNEHSYLLSKFLEYESIFNKVFEGFIHFNFVENWYDDYSDYLEYQECEKEILIATKNYLNELLGTKN